MRLIALHVALFAAAAVALPARAGTVIDHANIEHDLFTMPTCDIHKTGVLETWVAGRQVSAGSDVGPGRQRAAGADWPLRARANAGKKAFDCVV